MKTEIPLNRIELGMIEMEKLINYARKKLITKSEYNRKRKEIEKEYFGI